MATNISYAGLAAYMESCERAMLAWRLRERSRGLLIAAIGCNFVSYSFLLAGYAGAKLSPHTAYAVLVPLGMAVAFSVAARQVRKKFILQLVIDRLEGVNNRLKDTSVL